ncbi:NnrU family protein [Allorhizobium undicola]|uniref:NnrU family protein n=1 Tax=Allorhizobium undicola TaxID=78527 RepID=UPI000486DB6A|nr:NnrU family protein [Allorhizobium undicola]
MTLLILGLILFLGQHSLRIIAPDQRLRLMAQLGDGGWKIGYSLLSLLTLAVLIYGYAAAPVINVWYPPMGMNHLTVTLMLFASICLAASLLPAGHIATKTKHPLILAVKIWAFSHLASNGDLRSILLFAAFLAWGVIMRIALKRAERAGAVTLRPFMSARYDFGAIGLGVVFWGAMIFRLHEWLIGVQPLPF